MIDMSALSESKRNDLTQASIAVEDDQTHIISIFRPLQLKGLPVVTHLFSPEEKVLISKSDLLQLRFASQFSQEPILVMNVEYLTKTP